MTDLDTILSGGGAPASASDNTPATPETPAPAQSDASSDAPADNDGGDQQGMVPHAALHAEKQKSAKRYTEQVADFEKRMVDSNSAWERRFNEMMTRLAPQNQPQQQAPPDFFENPTEAARHAVSPDILELRQTILAQSRMLAETKFGDDKVKSAEDAFMAAASSRTLDPADYNRVVNSPNRYAEAVQWHQRELARQEIGDDTVAYRQRVEAEILAKYGIDPKVQQQPGQAAPQQLAPVMPSNLAAVRNVGSRSGPAWSGPAPLNDIFDRSRAKAS